MTTVTSFWCSFGMCICSALVSILMFYNEVLHTSAAPRPIFHIVV